MTETKVDRIKKILDSFAPSKETVLSPDIMENTKRHAYEFIDNSAPEEDLNTELKKYFDESVNIQAYDLNTSYSRK